MVAAPVVVIVFMCYFRLRHASVISVSHAASMAAAGRPFDSSPFDTVRSEMLGFVFYNCVRVLFWLLSVPVALHRSTFF